MKEKITKILRWSQKYTKLDMVYFAQNSFWVSFGQLANNVLSFGLIIAFANLLDKETYGLYQYILSIAGVLNIFTLTGMNASVNRAVAKGDEGAFRASVSYQMKWNVMMLTAFLAISGYYYIRGDEILALSFLILGIFVPATLALNTYGAFLTGKKLFKQTNIAGFLSTLVYAAGMLVVMYYTENTPLLIAVYAASTFFMTLFFYFYFSRKYKAPVGTDNKETFRYGRELTFIQLIGPIAGQIDKIILTQFWGPVQLANYAIAISFPNRIIPFLKSFTAIGFPKFVNKTPKELNTVFYRRILQGMFVGLIVTLLYAVIAPLLFTYLLPQYVEVILISQILGLSFIFAIPTRYIGSLFESQKMSKHIFFNTTVNSITAIVLYIVLGITGGLMGLAIAFVLYTISGFLVNLFVWRHASKKSPEGINPQVTG